jgi:hypothetical protein
MLEDINLNNDANTSQAEFTPISILYFIEINIFPNVTLMDIRMCTSRP